MAGRRVLRCSVFCILFLLGHVLLSFSISRNFIGMAKVVRCRFQRSRLQYYKNSTSSFNLPKLQIILSNDICPQPGPTNESISFYYQNARSLKAFALNDDGTNECKPNLLKDIVYSSEFDLIAITETLLKPSRLWSLAPKPHLCLYVLIITSWPAFSVYVFTLLYISLC